MAFVMLWLAVGLLALVSPSDCWLSKDPLESLQKLDEILQRSHQMEPSGSVVQTHATFNELVATHKDRDYADYGPTLREVIITLADKWKLDNYDCRWNADDIRTLDDSVSRHSNVLSGALVAYVKLVYGKLVDHCTRLLSDKKWKRFLKAKPNEARKHAYEYERQRALKLMDVDTIDIGEPDELLFHKMAARVRHFKEKNRNAPDLYHVFLNVGHFVNNLLSNINRTIPDDAPKEVKKLHALWFVWSKVVGNHEAEFLRFYRSKTAEEQEALKAASGATSAESGIAACAATFRLPVEQVRETLSKACESLDRRAAALANLVDALELATSRYVASRAAIFCSQLKSA